MSSKRDDTGASASDDVRLVAVVGNPNAGKSTIFNALTGASQKVGNYPGVTVEKVSAEIRVGATRVEVVDVPGLYSLDAVSEDEKVAVDVLSGSSLGRKPDLVVCVVSATNLERNLYLFTQLAHQNLPIVVAVTMSDVAKRKGQDVHASRLADLLGVEVVMVVAHKKIGVNDLKNAIERNLSHPRQSSFLDERSFVLEAQVALLRERFARSGLDNPSAELRNELVEPTTEFTQRLEEMPDLLTAVKEAREIVDQRSPDHLVSDRYQWTSMVQAAVVSKTSEVRRRSFTDRIDYVLTHRFFGLIVFVAIMYVVFQSIYTFAQPLMVGIDSGFGWLAEVVSPWFDGRPVIQSLVTDGIIGGVGGAIVFLPQIVILFFFIAVLEGTGYLARAAFLMDKLLGWAGLNGRAFVPLLSSFACAIPGIMAARVMPDPKSRLATVLVAPLMSCSARLPVYLLLIGAFIEPAFGPAWAGFALFAMHFLGLFIAIPVVLVLNRGVIKGKRLPFFLELPPYQMPKWRDIWLSMYIRAKTFLQTAATIIVVMSIAIWATLYFPRDDAVDAAVRANFVKLHPDATESKIEALVDGKRMENSYLGRFGKSIEPVFEPAGFDWRLSTAILSAFPAREVVVASMGVIFNLGDEQDEKSSDLRRAIQNATWPDGRPLMTNWTAVGLMVFFALCCQCMATLATVKRETGTWKWPAFMFVYMTVLAYVFAVGIHQLGLRFG